MSKKGLLLLLLLNSWTVLLGQTRGSSLVLKDTNQCYTPTELRTIALKLVAGSECDTLLKIAHTTIIFQDTIIQSQAKTIDKQEVRYLTTEHLADEYKMQKEFAERQLEQEKKTKKWILGGWAGTTVLMTILTVLALIH